jgi:membrane peptidoglycan carboxypeptidase
MSRPVADKVRHMLLDVVDEGTALQAALDNYLLAGKTGTPRATVGGRYVGGRYNPNFVSLFPGDNPQYVVVVKMTAPQSSIFAAQTAAPVTKSILEAAVAARNAALDRVKLASSVLPTKRDSIRQSGEPRVASLDVADNRATESLAPPPDTADRGSVPYVYTLPSGPEVAPPRAMRPVPDVRGLLLRDAVRSLHKAGFRVQLARGTGGASATNPAAGALAPPGTLVRLTFDPHH